MHQLSPDAKVSFLHFSSRITHSVYLACFSSSCLSQDISLYTISSNILFLKPHKNFYLYTLIGFMLSLSLSVIQTNQAWAHISVRHLHKRGRDINEHITPLTPKLVLQNGNRNFTPFCRIAVRTIFFLDFTSSKQRTLKFKISATLQDLKLPPNPGLLCKYLNPQ